MNNRKPNVLKLCLGALCLALCLVLPFLTGQIPLSPMHIPVLLCGFICGPVYAGAVGAVAPLLRNVLFGMPPLFPTGVAMCFELAAYGIISGLVYAKMKGSKPGIYVALIVAMLGGRVVWGIVQMLLLMGSDSPFTWAAFMSGAFINAVPGIIVHIVLIPLLVMALEKAMPQLRAKDKSAGKRREAKPDAAGALNTDK